MNFFLQAYQKYIRSRLDYGIASYGSSKQINMTWFKEYKTMMHGG